MKGTHPYRPRKLGLCGIPINGEHNVTNFKKAFRYQIWKTKKKKKNSIKRIHSLDSKIRKLDDQC